MRSLNLRRLTTSLVVDHITVHIRTQTASIHILEKAEEQGDVGQDIDGVTAQELGLTGDTLSGLTGAAVIAFVSQVAGGQIPVSLDTPPEEE